VAQNSGWIGAAFGLGFIIGPSDGGWLELSLEPRSPFLVAAGLSFEFVLYGFCASWVTSLEEKDGHFNSPEELTPSLIKAIEWKKLSS